MICPWIKQQKLIPMLLTFLLICLPGVSAFGQTAYDLQIVAQTGQPILDPNPGGAGDLGVVSVLNQGPGINDAGKVSFIATAGTDVRVMVRNGSVVEQNLGIFPS